MVAFDMDQCAVAAHSHGRLPRAAAASFAASATPDFVAAVEALAAHRTGGERRLGLALATHSDLAQHSAAKPRAGPAAVILGEELGRAVLYAAVPAHAHRFFVVGWNPRVRCAAAASSKPSPSLRPTFSPPQPPVPAGGWRRDRRADPIRGIRVVATRLTGC
eukprot:SAG11_NODE_1335_length_5174_cov_4.761773_4_plen_162_part_00